MKVSLKRFLETGRLEGIQPGMTREQIVEAIGPPETTGYTSRKYRRPSIYLYGNLEVWFRQSAPDTCIGAYIESSGANATEFRLPTAYEIEDWELGPGTTRAEVEAYLGSQGLAFQLSDKAPRGKTVLIVLPGRVRLSFDESDRLWSFYAGID